MSGTASSPKERLSFGGGGLLSTAGRGSPGTPIHPSCPLPMLLTRPVLRGACSSRGPEAGSWLRMSTPPGRPGSRRAGLRPASVLPLPRDRPGSPRWLSARVVPKDLTDSRAPSTPTSARSPEVCRRRWSTTPGSRPSSTYGRIISSSSHVEAVTAGVETFVVDDGWFVGRYGRHRGAGGLGGRSGCLPQRTRLVHRRI